MNRFIYFITAITIVLNASSILAEIYKTYPHKAYHFEYPPYSDTSTLYTGITPYGLPAASGTIVYDANLDSSNSGNVLLPPVTFQINGSDFAASSYPYSRKDFNHVKFNISSNGPAAVTNGLTSFTATFYEGTYSFSTFYSPTTSASTVRSIDFSVMPVSLSISAFIADDNNDWVDRIQPYNNDDFFRSTSYNGLAGVLGLNTNDTEGAGIELFNLRGSLTMLVQEYDAGGHLTSSTNSSFIDPFNLRTYAVVPEIHSLWISSTVVGLLTSLLIRNQWRRTTVADSSH